MSIRSVFLNPKVMLPLTALLLINLAIVLVTYIYNQKSQNLAYTQTFQELEAINNIKHHKLKLFFYNTISDIEVLASDTTIINLAEHSAKKKDYKKLIETYTQKNSYINKYLNEYVYDDMLLIDSLDASIKFSVLNPEFIGEKLNSSLFQESHVFQLYKDVLKTKKTCISDMEFSVLNLYNPYMLLATPVEKNGQIISVLVLILPSYTIDNLIHYREGMGKTGESYVVGMDKLLRTDSFLNPKFNLENSFLYPEEYTINTVAVEEALANHSSHRIIKDYRDIDVLSAYKPFVINGIQWALISELDVDELKANYTKLQRDILILSVVVSVMITMLGYILIMKILRFSVVEPLKKSYKHAKSFEDIINNSLNEIYIFDPTTLKFTYVNSSALENSGYSYEEFLNMTPMDIKPQFDAELFAQIIKPLLKKELGQIYFETKHKRKDGSLYDVEIQLQLMHIDNKDKFIAFIHDISKRNEAIEEKKKLYDQATHDYLTKIYNRQMFDEIYLQEFKSFARYKIPVSLILFDIDNFKHINDTFGHDMGDKVLIELVNLVKRHVRDSDIFARWGGEEFVILMKETTIDIAYEKAEEIRKKIENYKIEGVGYITCSFGVASPSDQTDPNTIFKNADQALYTAKHSGKNNVQKSV